MFTLAARLRATLEQLETSLNDLTRLLGQDPSQILQAACYPLPDVPAGKEHEPIEQISVSRLIGESALATALQSYRQWHMRADCSSKASFRLPGYLVLPTDARPALVPLVEQINQLKQQFRSQVQEAEGRDQKFTLVHDTFPGLITLQVYRQLVLLPRPASRLGFTWANKQIIRKIDKDELVRQLNAAKATPPALTDALTWQQCIDREIYDVKRLPAGVELRLRRPVKTHPMVNVRWAEEVSPRQQQVKAHLPLLLCQDTPPAVTPLGDYPPAKTRQRRPQRIADEPLIPRLHIYPYYP
ncbi:DNA replication terminus site-binding protein [Zobellella aerophila]|uniref:DNA replication terminus site-binding protein n=1 Tax=Zobellella aerophila TaxID=870480 RepID=A0ABP6V899_9GAMM